MTKILYTWIRDIAFYTLLMTVVLHVLPEKGQRKYLQFFMGVVLIILVISPALSFAKLDRALDETYVRQTYDLELQEFLRRQEAIEEEYQELLEERLKEAAEKEEQAGSSEHALQEEAEGENQRPREGEEIEIPEIHVEFGSPEEN